MTDAPGIEPAGDQPGPDTEPRGRIASARAKAEQLQHLAEERLERERAQRGWVRKLFDAYEADRNRGGELLPGDSRTACSCGGSPRRSSSSASSA